MRVIVTELPPSAGGRVKWTAQGEVVAAVPGSVHCTLSESLTQFPSSRLNALTVIQRSHKRKLIYNKIICISKYGYTKLEDTMKQADVGRDLILIKEGVQI